MGKKNRILENTVVKTSKLAIPLMFGNAHSKATVRSAKDLSFLCTAYKTYLTLKHLRSVQSKKR
jgi:hypothetical protein